MMEKMLTFEEWDSKFNSNREETETTRRGWFNSARQGMIPADRAIEVPEVSEWPQDATRLVLIARNGFDWIKDIADFPRPTPQWSPQIGDRVFYKHSGDCVGVDVIDRIENEGKTAYWMKGTPDNGWFEVKPFDQSKIGLSWSQI